MEKTLTRTTGAAGQIHLVEVTARLGVATTAALVSAAHQLGIKGVQDCTSSRLYFLQGELSAAEIERLSRELLADPVTETFYLGSSHIIATDHTIDVTLLPGVTDPAAANLVRAAHLLGITRLQQAATGQRFHLQGDLDAAALNKLAETVFSNPVIQRCTIDSPISAPFIPYQQTDDTVEIIETRALDDEALLALSRERRLSLDLHEMQAIRAYFQEIGRDPTDAELEMLAQTWSEHCVHKTFKALIDYTGPDGKTQQIDGILKTYIRAATEKVNKSWVRSAFVDNAGIIAFDADYDIAFKAETHNRPSAIEPFGGANTGVGGVIRDVLGVSAKPIANTDILCFGLPDTPSEKLPQGVLHPRRVAEGVVHGIEDYGNKMGIPTVNGAIYYHPGYTSNPLVFCGCVGILPHGAHPSAPQPGDLIVVIGGRTGRDGLRGATFSSMEMDTTTSQVSGSAVQIGNPISEKQVMEVVLRARDEKLYSAITDCGAGGLSSAVGEITSSLGARVQLEDVPLKYPGLHPWEIWLSEAQERMVLAVPPAHWERFKTICAGQDVEAVAIGTFEQTGHLLVYYGEQLVVDLTMTFLHAGIPQMRLQAVWNQPQPAAPAPEDISEHFKDTLLRLLAHPNIRSKEEVIRRYDHEVQGGTAVKPLVGVANHGPSDAAVIVPLTPNPKAGGERPTRAVAIANGLCPLVGETDPYTMAWAAIDEAIRNLVAVGADPDQIAILDNFCWGNTRLPDRLGALVRCAQGCHDAAVAYGVPFISGKDSLNNEYIGADGERHAIPGTLVISAVGIVPDVAKTVTMDLKLEGNLLYVVGEARGGMGGSHYNLIHGIEGGTLPQPNPKALDTFRALHQAIHAGLVQSCHDVSEGGIAVALAEMCMAGNYGADVELIGIGGKREPHEYERILFSESPSRFIVEVNWKDEQEFKQLFADLQVANLGAVHFSDTMTVESHSAIELFEAEILELERAWRGDRHVLARRAVPAPQAATDSPSHRAPAVHTTLPRVLILHANGTNRDHDAFLACQLAGGVPEIVHVNQLASGERSLLDYHMLIVPGGFSYGDDLGAGVLWAQDLRHRLKGIEKFIEEGRPVLGICNGFQALVKAGLLPGVLDDADARRTITLTYNQQGHFECRWVYLQPNPNSPSLFTEGLAEPIYCPVAHGEGRIMTASAEVRDDLWARGLIPLVYVDKDGAPAAYPDNPNGSEYGIAALCNPAGNVMGLMPHPENHIFPWQHPRRHRSENGMDGLRLFKNGVKHA